MYHLLYLFLQRVHMIRKFTSSISEWKWYMYTYMCMCTYIRATHKLCTLCNDKLYTNQYIPCYPNSSVQLMCLDKRLCLVN